MIKLLHLNLINLKKIIILYFFMYVKVIKYSYKIFYADTILSQEKAK